MNKIHVLRAKTRVLFVFFKIIKKDEPPLVFSILGAERRGHLHTGRAAARRHGAAAGLSRL